MYRVAEQSVRLACLVGRLPDICAVVILEFSKRGKGLVIQDEGRLPAVRTLQRIHKADEVIGLHRRRQRIRHHAAARGRKQADGLALAVTV